MRREAFKMYLKPGFEAEYEKRHNAIWPELRALLKESGVSEYSIFWDKETNVLFAFQLVSGEGGSQDLGENPIVQNGGHIWRTLWKLMPTTPLFHSVKEVFYMP